MAGVNFIGKTDNTGNWLEQQRQSRALQTIDKDTSDFYDKLKKERRVQGAGLASAQRLSQEYKQQGLDVHGKMDEEGNLSWDNSPDIANRLRQSASDMSKNPQFKARLGMQAGSAGYSQDVQGSQLQTQEQGSVGSVNDEQLRLAQASRPEGQHEGQPPQQQAQPNSFVGPQLMHGAVAPPSIKAKLQQQAAQRIRQSAGMATTQDPVAVDDASINRAMSRSESKSFSQSRSHGEGGGSVEPISTTAQYKEAGFRDANPEMAAQRLRSQMAGIQGDVSRGMGLTEQPTSEERTANQDLANINSRYQGLNQTLNPDAQAKIDGGRIGTGQTSDSNSKSASSNNSASAGANAAKDNGPTEVKTLSGASLFVDKGGKTTTGGRYKPGTIGKTLEDAMAKGEIPGAKLVNTPDGMQWDIPAGTNLNKFGGNLRQPENLAGHGEEGYQNQAGIERAKSEQMVRTYTQNSQSIRPVPNENRYPVSNKPAYSIEETKKASDRMKTRMNKKKP